MDRLPELHVTLNKVERQEVAMAIRLLPVVENQALWRQR
jgi:hypothetical protein